MSIFVVFIAFRQIFRGQNQGLQFVQQRRTPHTLWVRDLAVDLSPCAGFFGCSMLRLIKDDPESVETKSRSCARKSLGCRVSKTSNSEFEAPLAGICIFAVLVQRLEL